MCVKVHVLRVDKNNSYSFIKSCKNQLPESLFGFDLVVVSIEIVHVHSVQSVHVISI